MINLYNNAIEYNLSATPIKAWEVWFMTPFGVTNNLKEAKEKCLTRYLDPDLTINPVSVAIGENGHYEIFFPRR